MEAADAEMSQITWGTTKKAPNPQLSSYFAGYNKKKKKTCELQTKRSPPCQLLVLLRHGRTAWVDGHYPLCNLAAGVALVSHRGTNVGLWADLQLRNTPHSCKYTQGVQTQPSCQPVIQLSACMCVRMSEMHLLLWYDFVVPMSSSCTSHPITICLWILCPLLKLLCVLWPLAEKKYISWVARDVFFFFVLTIYPPSFQVPKLSSVMFFQAFYSERTVREWYFSTRWATGAPP